MAFSPLLRSTLLAAAALLAAPFAQAQALACGTVLTQSVSLRADVVCTSPQQTGLVIGAHNVSIDLNGFAIVGVWSANNSPTGSSAGVESNGFDGVTITGGNIFGFYIPISIVGGRGHFIGKIRAMQPYSYGVYLHGTSFSRMEQSEVNGVYLLSSFPSPSIANRIESNRIGGAGGEGGLELSECITYENVVTDNTIVGDPWVLQPVVRIRNQAFGNNLVGNTIRGSVQYNGSFNTFRKNRVTAFVGSSWAMGIFLDRTGNAFCKNDEGTGNVVEGNDFSGGIHGVRLQSLSGMGAAVKNRINGNQFANHTIGALFFTVSANDNDGLNNAYVGLPFPVIDHGQGNRW